MFLRVTGDEDPSLAEWRGPEPPGAKRWLRSCLAAVLLLSFGYGIACTGAAAAKDRCIAHWARDLGQDAARAMRRPFPTTTDVLDYGRVEGCRGCGDETSSWDCPECAKRRRGCHVCGSPYWQAW